MKHRDIILKANNISAGYGKKTIIDNSDIVLNKGEINLLIGHNGSGKSTWFKILSGLLKPWQGEIYFKDENITNWSIEKRIKSGIVYLLQNNNIFPNLTVEDNLKVIGRLYNQIDFQDIYLQFPDLENKLNKRAGLLSGGEKQQLAIAMTLIPEPEIMLLDEPSASLAEEISKSLFKTLKEINLVKKISMIIIEQNVKYPLEISDHVYVLKNGKILLNNSSIEFIENNNIQNVF